jgi:hypothetical protein
VQAAGSIVPRLLRDLGLEQGLLGFRAIQEWPDVVGERIARRTVTKYRTAFCACEVEGSAWACELGFLERRLLLELERRLGARAVRKLHFVQPRGGIQR